MSVRDLGDFERPSRPKAGDVRANQFGEWEILQVGAIFFTGKNRKTGETQMVLIRETYPINAVKANLNA